MPPSIEQDGTPESAAEAADLRAVEQRLERADGALVEVKGTRSAVGERLFVTARYAQDGGLPEPDHFYLNVDMFADRNGTLTPVGMRDFEVRNGVADGNKQRHGLLAEMPNARADELAAHHAADRHWASGEGVKLSDEDMLAHASRRGDLKNLSQEDMGKKVYQERGLGTLMTAIALLVLRQRGVRDIKFTHLTEPAERMWKRFGYTNGLKNLSLDQIFSSPAVAREILHLIKANQEK